MSSFFCRLSFVLIGLCFFSAAPRDNEWPATVPEMITRYYADVEALNRVYIFRNSPEYTNRVLAYNDQVIDHLKAVDFGKLPVSDQVDWLLLKRNIMAASADLKESARQYDRIASALPFSEELIALQRARRRGAFISGDSVAHVLAHVRDEIRSGRARLASSPRIEGAIATKGSDAVTDLRSGLANVLGFYEGYDPQFTWWVKKPLQDLQGDLNDYASFIKSRALADSATPDGTGINGHPIGDAKLRDLLAFEMIPYSPEQLVDIANREFAWCDREVRKASQEMGFGDDWKKALEKTKTNYVAPGHQPALINRLAEEAIHYVESNDLVTIPPLAKEVWRMSMLSPEQQRFAPFFLGGESILVAYPTPEMDQATKEMSLRSNNYGFAHATVFHELIPGHNLQGFMNQRFKPYRRVFNTPFSVEGWALYWEMLLWDRGFDKTPEEKMGALFWRMHRCARIIFSLNYHLGKWTPKQCIDFLVDRVGHERFSAESEVRRSFTGGYGPLYQIAYMMGGLQLRALHHEVVDGHKMTDKQFHDAFLHENTMPIELFRAIVTGKKLVPDYTASWKFAEQ